MLCVCVCVRQSKETHLLPIQSLNMGASQKSGARFGWCPHYLLMSTVSGQSKTKIRSHSTPTWAILEATHGSMGRNGNRREVRSFGISSPWPPSRCSSPWTSPTATASRISEASSLAPWPGASLTDRPTRGDAAPVLSCVGVGCVLFCLVFCGIKYPAKDVCFSPTRGV